VDKQREKGGGAKGSEPSNPIASIISRRISLVVNMTVSHPAIGGGGGVWYDLPPKSWSGMPVWAVGCIPPATPITPKRWLAAKLQIAVEQKLSPL